MRDRVRRRRGETVRHRKIDTLLHVCVDLLSPIVDSLPLDFEPLAALMDLRRKQETQTGRDWTVRNGSSQTAMHQRIKSGERGSARVSDPSGSLSYHESTVAQGTPPELD